MNIYSNEMLKSKIRRRKTVKRIVNACFVLLSAFVVICVCIVFYQKIIAKRKAVDLFGYSIFAVMSGSMLPSIDVYDVVVVKRVSVGKLSVGDVITFFDGDGNIITHRIAEISENDGEVFYKTKGDANNANDTELIPYESVIGKYSYKISGGVRIFAAITSPLGIIIIISLFGFIGFSIIRKIRIHPTGKNVRIFAS